MSIDWQSDPELADLVRRARNGERIVDDSDVEADRREARKARNREASRLCHERRRARLKAMRDGTME
ncbi:hypothetical protein [Bifidobacterium adolescentis]|jgi:hypothetical protein|uniref:hypothetical protein n=1 Tax=Bifidobacterium adolescentis TaxID=1680 RepID=UPI001C2406E8|nr:hypothetical protein [Bifidobacterium adolescentis]DAT47559.1 MAG TPA: TRANSCRIPTION FACTOR MAFB, DNA-BINDING, TRANSCRIPTION, PROTO-ONCOGENE, TRANSCRIPTION.9A [Caudoviricetes sp.]MBU9010057.1 hypothetical protein [Bifidobacterium adolescentis]MBU9080077.1 hypothetical protein [Bifidobacterium adolescentis]MBU9101306.1 hypothetical protein [Bifidobacterium adolescentis]MBU9103189.1 hypothetical protein [Bifidobacterium adolescentis]